MEIEEGKYAEEHSVVFSEKGTWERFKDFVSFLPGEAVTFSSVAASGWALAEILIAVFDNRPSVSSLAIPVLAMATVAATYRAYSKLSSYVPDALRSESKQAQSIFRKQKFGWQWALAKEMLTNRIGDSEAELRRIRLGIEFIQPNKLSPKQYHSWLRVRPEAIIRLLTAVTIQCTAELPATIGATQNEEGLKELKLKIDAFSSLYATATAFERDCHAIVPPEEFEAVHEVAHGWTDTIRDGVSAFMGIIAKLSELDRKQVEKSLFEPPEFSIVFEPPESLPEFSNRLSQVDPTILEEE